MIPLLIILGIVAFIWVIVGKDRRDEDDEWD